MRTFKFGHVDGSKVGTTFNSRQELSKSGIHAPPMHGIWGREKEGACSIVMSGGYEDDIDDLNYVLYTGHGGQDVPGGKQIRDQEFTRGNKALQLSQEYDLPIRVTRGFQILNGPETGYRYDGLYRITFSEKVIGRSGFDICRFHLQSEDSILNLETKLKQTLKPNYKRTTRSQSVVDKIDRDVALAERIKEIYNYQCQVCGDFLEKPGGRIAIGAHIKGLGRPHEGPDHLSNMLCLCPNHHAQFDAFSFYIEKETLTIKGSHKWDGKKIKVDKKHKLNLEFFNYHKALYLKKQKSLKIHYG